MEEVKICMPAMEQEKCEVATPLTRACSDESVSMRWADLSDDEDDIWSSTDFANPDFGNSWSNAGSDTGDHSTSGRAGSSNDDNSSSDFPSDSSLPEFSVAGRVRGGYKGAASITASPTSSSGKQTSVDEGMLQCPGDWEAWQDSWQYPDQWVAAGADGMMWWCNDVGQGLWQQQHSPQQYRKKKGGARHPTSADKLARVSLIDLAKQNRKVSVAEPVCTRGAPQGTAQGKAETDTEASVCPKCGGKVGASFRFCAACGHALQA